MLDAGAEDADGVDARRLVRLGPFRLRLPRGKSNTPDKGPANQREWGVGNKPIMETSL